MLSRSTGVSNNAVSRRRFNHLVFNVSKMLAHFFHPKLTPLGSDPARGATPA